MSRAIPTAALAGARATLKTLHSDTVDVYRLTSTRSSSGATKTTYGGTPTTTAVPCRIEHVSDERRLMESERFGDATHVVYLSYDAPIQEGDKLIAAGGKRLQVIGLNDQQSERFVLEAIAKEHE